MLYAGYSLTSLYLKAVVLNYRLRNNAQHEVVSKTKYINEIVPLYYRYLFLCTVLSAYFRYKSEKVYVLSNAGFNTNNLI